MKAAIVTIGDEILIGQITDTNSGYIAKALDKIGVKTYEMRSISDDKNHIIETLNQLKSEFQIVIFTGGLGPTKDDITKKTFAEYFNDQLVQDDAVLAHVTKLIETYMKRPMTQLNINQALVLSKAKVLFNKLGTAPGILIEDSGTVFVSLPGVPYEMKHLIDEEVIPHLINKFERPFIIHRTLITYGRGESLIAEQIEAWENNLPAFIKLAYLPSMGKVRLRLSATGLDEKALLDEIESQVNQLKDIIGEIIIGYNEEETIEYVLGRLLTEKKLTIATIESCTGGKIAESITAIPGSSNYFLGSLVAYHKNIKVNNLGVPAELIEKYSVVSEQVAKEMVIRGKEMFGADIVISTTGNAGPSKDETNEDLGVVYIGIGIKDFVFVEKFELGQPRDKVINRAVNKGLEMVYKEILNLS